MRKYLSELIRPEILEQADYIAVHIEGDTWQVLKSGYGQDIIDTEEHNERLMDADLPMVLHSSYLVLDDEGLVVVV